MSYTSKQWKAINWIVKRDNLKPQISAWPLVRFTRPDGTVLEESITTIADWYDNAKAQQKRANQQARKEEKKG